MLMVETLFLTVSDQSKLVKKSDVLSENVLDVPQDVLNVKSLLTDVLLVLSL